ADLAQEAGVAFFEEKIRPVLAERCYECHSNRTGKKKGGLILDTKAGVLDGGDSGHAVVPGEPGESLLLTAISYADADLEMPPKKQLGASVVEDFREWIAMGAPDPRDDAAVAELVQSGIDIEEGKEFWAYQKPVKRGDEAGIDDFVGKVLEKNGLKAAPAADRRTLLRRVTFDLTGLPPAAEEIAAFLADEGEGAFGEVVERLLASEAFGERWGRHWMDVARYAESSGKEVNLSYPQAWRYRNWVIEAFNADKPFDEFLKEQVAGDLMVVGDGVETEEEANQVVATGFLALGPKSHNEGNVRQFTADMIDEQIDTLTKSVLGTTVACARCHDHKFDPIPMEDYYALAGIFGSSDTYFGTVVQQGNRRGGELIWVPGAKVDTTPGAGISRREVKELEAQLATARERQRDLFAAAREARAGGKVLETRQQQQFQRVRSEVGILEGKLAAVDDEGRPHPYAMGMWDPKRPTDARLLLRGEIDQPAQRVPRGMVQVLNTTNPPAMPRGESGRRELAEWLASEDNPLTARVMVNRAWHWLFGRGLVRTVDNFGATGEKPSHPELLDWLAVEFMENGWSVKRLVREIVMSEAYRRSSEFDEASFQIDPENQYVWRMSKRRLEAEAIRDAMLAVSGRLDREAPVGSAVARVGDGIVGRRQVQVDTGGGGTKRSVYLPVVRGDVQTALEVFDFAEPSLVTGDRDVTTVPSQALYLMNSEFVQQQAAGLAQRLRDESGQGRMVKDAFELVYGREPTVEEVRKTRAYFQRFTTEAGRAKKPASKKAAMGMAMESFCQALLGSAEFRYLD
ncbi:MAG: PSD1 and planctomycete cytochrome C domain-containing protein, partial [Verrucomicrobiales bacterium]|nr:PSD1 and planctomycete cytochrome C domain-containing protein [Verrucomicrobiales bacterium]